MTATRLKSNCLLLFFLGIFFMSKAQVPSPAAKQQQSILLFGATAHLGNGEVIPRSAIGFRDGKIDMVLAALDARMDSTQYDTVIYLQGKQLYPGFISPNSRLGLVEFDAVRATRDANDVGKLNPHIRAIPAYNTDSRIIPTVRSNGILTAQITPKGGRISGSSSVVNLDAWNWEDALIKEGGGMHLNWPSVYLKRSWQDDKKRKKEEEYYQEELKQLRSYFEQALAYSKTDFVLEKNIRFEAMRSLFDKKAKLFVHAERVQEITDAIYFFDQFDLEVVIVGGSEAYLIAELLKDRKIPILLRRIHSLPLNQDDPIDLPYRLPKMLYDAGLLVGLQNSGSMETMGTRNLPFYAGTAVAYGLDKEQALAMITSNTAKILGVDNVLGTLAVGKYATLFISEGDALDMRGNKITMAFISGRKIDLDDPHKALYRKFTKKYETEENEKLNFLPNEK